MATTRRRRLHIHELPDLKRINAVDVFRQFSSLPFSSLLLSGGDHDCARFSIIGLQPFLRISARGRHVSIIDEIDIQTMVADPFAALLDVLEQYHLDDFDTELPINAGGIGYFAYELKNHLEILPQKAIDDLGLPDLYFCFYEFLLIHDRKQDNWYLTQFSSDNCRPHTIENLLNKINQTAKPSSAPPPPTSLDKPTANFTRQAYLRAVEKVRRYIIDGDIYQANLSQRFSLDFNSDPYDTFVRLFNLNPAPFYAFLHCEDYYILSSSPERFLLRQGDYVETRPIKGTRPRGKSPDADQALKTELQESFKDDAELSMIVDLLRNDLSRVCAPGSVMVREHKRIEAYTNVFHLVSIVTGLLDKNKDSMDLIKACFPGGSITGCPKIRSMEIIDELEPLVRSVYTGSIGYLSFHNTLDLNIAIRTSIVHDQKIHFNVGGGIVYDSEPEEEYLETLYKGESIIRSLGHSLQGGGLGDNLAKR